MGAAALADPGPVAQLGTGRCAGNRRGASRRPGCRTTSRAASPSPPTRSASAIHSSAQANVWNAEISMNSTRIMSATMSSSSTGMSSGRSRSASAPGRPGPKPIRSSIPSMSRSSDRSIEGDVAGGEPHVPMARLPSRIPASSRPCASNRPRSEVVDRRPADVLDEAALQVARLEEADVGPVALDRADPGQRGDRAARATPERTRNRACSTFGNVRSQSSRGTSMSVGGERLAVARAPRLDGRDAGTWSAARRNGPRRRSRRGSAPHRRSGAPRCRRRRGAPPRRTPVERLPWSVPLPPSRFPVPSRVRGAGLGGLSGPRGLRLSTRRRARGMGPKGTPAGGVGPPGDRFSRIWRGAGHRS